MRKGRIDTKVYWALGHLIDLVHMPFVIVLVIWGSARFTGELYVSIVVTTVALQIGLMGCPCLALTAKLKQLHDPNYISRWSLTVFLYRKYGPRVGIAVFVFFTTLGLALNRFLFS